MNCYRRHFAISSRKIGHPESLHVDLIHIGSLLPVHLDADKNLLEDGSYLFALKRLSLHHVTPVAGSVPTDRKIGLPSDLALLPPGIPGQNSLHKTEQDVRLYRISCMLQEVRRLLLRLS